MKLIVGLGNPGRRYRNTPHNAGFAVVDGMAVRLGCTFRKRLRFRARTAEAQIGTEPVLLVKPETYMNRSGQAVGALLRFRKLDVTDVIVVVDDADLELGRIRIRPQGSSGGHRGLVSIEEHVGKGFARVRIGIGRSEQEALVDHVLTPLAASQRVVLDKVVEVASDAIGMLIEKGANEAMNAFNGVVLGETTE